MAANNPRSRRQTQRTQLGSEQDLATSANQQEVTRGVLLKGRQPLVQCEENRNQIQIIKIHSSTHRLTNYYKNSSQFVLVSQRRQTYADIIFAFPST